MEIIFFQKQNLPVHLLHFIAWFFLRWAVIKGPLSKCWAGILGAVDALRMGDEVCCRWSWEKLHVEPFSGLRKQL